MHLIVYHKIIAKSEKELAKVILKYGWLELFIRFYKSPDIIRNPEASECVMALKTPQAKTFPCTMLDV